MSCSPLSAARRSFGVAFVSLALLLAMMASGVSANGQPAQLPAVHVPGTGMSSSATAALTQCTPALEAPDRSTTFAGQMVAITMTQRMMMRIDVQERSPSEAYFHTISAPGLGVWRSSETGVKVYKYFKQVTNLPAPEVFRGVITFRWLAGKGHLLRQTVRHTQPCEQPEERPKLAVGQVQAQLAINPPYANYKIAVSNEGRTAASQFAVIVSVNGAAQTPILVSSLAAGSNTLLTATLPACSPSSTIEVQLDPQHQIEEAPGGGLTDRVACPLA